MKEIFSELIQNKNFIMFASAVAYVLGLFAYFTDKPILFAGIFTLCSLLLIIKKFPYKTILVWIAIFYFAFFNANFRIKNCDTLFKYAPCNCIVTGQIISVPNSNLKNNSKFFFKVESANINGKDYKNINNKTLVGINDYSKNPNFSDLKIGNYYKINGKLRRPFVSTNPSQFSYANYLKNYNTYTTFYADKDNIKAQDIKLSVKWRFLKYLNNKRDQVIQTHAKYIPSPYVDILGGVIFGDDAIAPPDYIKASFIHSGLLHILAASGLNVAFISSFLFFFMTRLGVPHRPRMLVGIIATIFYCLMTGLGASVIRAGLMLIFVLFGKLIDRDAHSISLLSFVGVLMLIYNPAYINDVGFQLSFIVTLGILLSLETIFKYTPKLPQWLSTSIFLPIVAQLWVIPIQMFYFNTVSLYSVFANIITMPFLSVISFGGFISSTFALFTPIADFVCKWSDIILEPCLRVLIYVSDFFAKMPHSLYYTTHPSVLQIILYYIILAGVTYWITIGFKNRKLIISSALLAFILILSATIHLPNNNFEIISFDVGNADAFLLKTPQNKYFIIDTGKMGYAGRRSQADMLILKYLRDKGIKRIDGLILTHFDSDHSGGAVDLINNLEITRVYVNSTTENKRLAKQIYKAAENNKSTSLILGKNKTTIYTEPDFSIKMYKADIPQHGHDSEANENSLITLLQYREMSMLFTGDSGIRAFNQLKNDLPQKITVLKVGHHGAKNVLNKEMMTYLNPKISIVSVGYNRYGHPHPLTVGLLSGTKILRTDKIHAIKIIADKKGYEIDNYDSNKRRFCKKSFTKYSENSIKP